MNIDKYFIIIILFCTLSCTQEKPGSEAFSSKEKADMYVMPDSVVLYINSAVDTMKRYSIKKDKINWTAFRLNVMEKAAGANTYAETYPALKLALQMLDDKHSFFKEPQQAVAWKEKPIKSKNKRWYAKRKKRKLGVLRDGMAEIDLSSYSSGNVFDNIKHAQDLQMAIQKLDSTNPKGWIVNLSYNSGGNMWPMLAGIGPLLIEGVQGSFYTSEQRKIDWYYKNGEVGTSDSSILRVPNPYVLKNKSVPIAIFISDRTASSGEAILISFKNNPNAKIFGEPTAGLSTANATFTLKDGAQLILTSAVFMDNKGNLYGGKIMPNVNLSELWYYGYGHEHHIMLGHVKKWFDSYNQ